MDIATYYDEALAYTRQLRNENVGREGLRAILHQRQGQSPLAGEIAKGCLPEPYRPGMIWLLTEKEGDYNPPLVVILDNTPAGDLLNVAQIHLVACLGATTNNGENDIILTNSESDGLGSIIVEGWNQYQVHKDNLNFLCGQLSNRIFTILQESLTDPAITPNQWRPLPLMGLEDNRHEFRKLEREVAAIYKDQRQTLILLSKEEFAQQKQTVPDDYFVEHAEKYAAAGQGHEPAQKVIFCLEAVCLKPRKHGFDCYPAVLQLEEGVVSQETSPPQLELTGKIASDHLLAGAKISLAFYWEGMPDSLTSNEQTLTETTFSHAIAIPPELQNCTQEELLPKLRVGLAVDLQRS